MTRKLRGFASITSLTVFLSLITGNAAHASTYNSATGNGTVACSNGGTFTIEENVLAYAEWGCSGGVVIPEGVTEIAAYAFEYLFGLTTITIPSTVTFIGESAFYYLYDLNEFIVASASTSFKAEAEVLFSKDGATLINFPMAKATPYTIPANVTTIGPAAFMGANLSDNAITIPSGVVNIGDGAFSDTGLTMITIPAGVVNIGEGAFHDNDLDSIRIPASVTSIGRSAFSRNPISQFTVDPLSASFNTDDGVLFSKNGQTLLAYPTIKSGAYAVPSYVQSIANSAFEGSSFLTSLTFAPSSQLETIGEGAFYQVSTFDSLTIPASVRSIGAFAFADGGSIESLTFAPGSQLTSIGRDAFNAAGPITEITIPAGVTSIPERAFGDLESLRTVTFAPNSQLTLIGSGSFRSALSLEVISIPASVTSIDRDAFYGATSLTSLTFAQDSRLMSIGDRAFEQAESLISLTIPASVKTIGYGAFSQDWEVDNALTSITFEQNSQLASIGDYAFFGMNALTGIVIPKSVKTIGVQSFATFGYDFAAPMSFTSVTFEAGSQLTSIGRKAFEHQRSLTEIVIPASVTSIGDDAFMWTRRLSSLTFAPNSQLRSIGDYAFENSRSIVSVTIPASVTAIGRQAFGFNYALTSFVFESGSQLRSIGASMFNSAAPLSAITIPAGVTSIGPGAFSNLTANATVEFLGNAPTTISPDSFRSGVSATRTNCATGFPDGSVDWNGLALSVSQSSDPCLVIYDLNGGYGLSASQLSANGQVVQAPTPPAKTGYTFANWSASNGGATIGFPYTPESGGSNIILYASWTPNTNRVIYDSRGGTSVPNGSFFTGGEIASAPTPPTRQGCIFLGWDLWSEGYEGGISFPYDPGLLEDITLYGYWDQDPSAENANCDPIAEVQPSAPSTNNPVQTTTALVSNPVSTVTQVKAEESKPTVPEADAPPKANPVDENPTEETSDSPYLVIASVIFIALFSLFVANISIKFGVNRLQIIRPNRFTAKK